MALPERTPHDATFKAVFSRPENALVLLRIAQAPAAELETWTGRVLDAKKIEDVFAVSRVRASRGKRRPKGAR